MSTMRSCGGIVCATAFSSVVFPVPVPPEIRMLWRAATATRRTSASAARDGADLDQIVQRESVRELPDGQRRSIDRTRREHRGHARAVLEARVEHRLALGDLVAARARDVLDRDREIPDVQRAIRDLLETSASLDEHPSAAAVHHHFRDGRIDQEVLDRPQERQDAIQAAHIAPRSR